MDWFTHYYRHQLFFETELSGGFCKWKKSKISLKKLTWLKKSNKKKLRGAEPLVFGHAELFLKARALIDHGWIGRLAETEEGGEAVAAPLFHPKKVRKNGWNGTKNPYKNLFYKVWHVWRSSNLLELPLIFVTLSQKKFDVGTCFFIRIFSSEKY